MPRRGSQFVQSLHSLLERCDKDRQWLANHTSRSYQAICTYLDGTHLPTVAVLDEILQALGATRAERAMLRTLRDEEVHLRQQAALTPASGWYLRDLRVQLTLTPPGEVVEERRIQVIRDLDEISNWADYPFDRGAEPPQPTVQVLSGGTLIREQSPYAGHGRTIIAPSQPLAAGQEHRYQIRRSVPKDMRPQYLMIPDTRCDRLTLQIHFDLAALPAWIRRVDGEPLGSVDAAYATGTPPPGSPLLTPDPEGRIEHEFSRLQLRLCYGIQWSQLTK